jgi:archaeal flagellar protein FlaJ
MYRLYSKLYPKKLREKYSTLLAYSGINIQPDRFMGFIVLMGLGIGLLAAFNLGRFIEIPFIVLFIAGFFLIESVVYIWFVLRIDKKAKSVEAILPDALQLMSSNLKAGLTIDKALMLSARPEFGVFEDEIGRVGKKITIGMPVEDALMEMNKRILSQKLKDSLTLITTGLKSGGELSELLDQTAKNLRDKELIEEKIKSNVMSYVIFIFAAIGIGTPLLFGLSSFLIDVLKSILGAIELPDSSTVNFPINISPVSINPGFIVMYSLVSLAVISTMGALTMGMISRGKKKYGIKYIPMLIAVTYGIFLISRLALSKTLGSLFTF